MEHTEQNSSQTISLTVWEIPLDIEICNDPYEGYVIITRVSLSGTTQDLWGVLDKRYCDALYSAVDEWLASEPDNF